MMPTRTPEDPRSTLIFLRGELVDQGWTDRALARAVTGGLLAKPRRGAYVAGEPWRALDARGRHELAARSVLRQASSPLVVSHTSGLVLHDCPEWGLDLGEVDVTRRDGTSGRREAGIRPHRGKILPEDVVELHGIEVMSPTRLALEVATQLDVEAGLVQLNDLVHRKLTSLEKIHARNQLGIDHWPDSLRGNVLLRLVDGRCESVGESRTLHLCWRQALPLPVAQHPIYDETGQLVALVDFAWPEHGVFLEFDGKIKYTTLLRDGETAADAVIREKKREELICRLTGWRCIRITWVDLARPEVTALTIRRLLFPARAAA